MEACFLAFFTIAVSGAAGGLASWLFSSPSTDKSHKVPLVLRTILGGSIVAFTIPLFLSIGKSSLLDNVLKAPSMSADFFVLTGFCVIAGFTSRRFLNSLAEKVLQLDREVEKTKEKIEKTAEAVEELDEAITDNNHDNRGDEIKTQVTETSPLAPSDINDSLATEPPLSDEEVRILKAASKLSKRTQTGIAKDSGIHRNQVAEFIDILVSKNLLRHTVSERTRGARIQITKEGTAALNNFLRRNSSSFSG